jgi:hypothetical protein
MSGRTPGLVYTDNGNQLCAKDDLSLDLITMRVILKFEQATTCSTVKDGFDSVLNTSVLEFWCEPTYDCLHVFIHDPSFWIGPPASPVDARRLQV